MSHFSGISGIFTQKEEDDLKLLFSDGSFYKEDSLILGFNGIPGTMLTNLTGSLRLIICGIGISPEGDKLLGIGDWTEIEKKGYADLTRLNGHFAGIMIKENTITLFNDPMGLREIYYFQTKEKFYFSTRLDFICRMTGINEPDVEALSSAWLLTNHFGTKSFVKGIKRLGSGGMISKNNKLEISNPNDYRPQFSEESDFLNTIEVIRRLTLLPINNGRNLSLALSGGMDSRVLFSILTRHNADFTVHTFGDSAQPDAQIAGRVSADNNVQHLFVPNTIPHNDELILYLKNIIGQTLLTMPASESLHKKSYGEIYRRNKFIIDGGYGEILRRELLNKVLVFEKQSLYNKNFERIIPHLRSARASIFKDEVSAQMEINITREILTECMNFIDTMEIGAEHWLDYFAIKKKMPNVNGPGQTAMDSMAAGYMPFAQKILLDAGFQLSPAVKKNSALFKSIIKKSNPGLENIPLIKNQIKYPYGTSSFNARIIALLKRKFSRIYQDPIRRTMLFNLREYLGDMIHSDQIRNSSLYDKDKIGTIYNKFINGDESYAGELDWFLTFELWRQSLKNY